MNAIYKHYAKRGVPCNMVWSSVDRWPTHPGLIQTHAQHIREELAKFPEEDRDNVVILFSAHSLPLRVSIHNNSHSHVQHSIRPSDLWWARVIVP